MRDVYHHFNAAAFSHGIVHVIVNGVPVVRASGFDDKAQLQGQRVLVGTRMPGRPIRAPREGARP